MSNRIPKIIEDFSESGVETNEIDFLSFKNWLNSKENQAKTWLTVGRNQKAGDTDYFTTSCLIEASEESLKVFLCNSNWYINSEFGNPSKYQKLEENVKYDDGLRSELDGVTYSPFIFRRHYSNLVPDHFQVIEHFLLYYNAFWIEERKEYHAINEQGELSTIAKYRKVENNELFEVDVHTLRDYLAVKNSFLARFHVHHRRSTTDISEFLKTNGETSIISEQNSYFELNITDDIQYDDIKSTSRLIGKDIILPYSSPKSHSWSMDKQDKKYVDFIIDRNENGEELFCNCNPDNLSSYFLDKGKLHYLTPVYFKSEVLHKYYSEPKKYSITEFDIRYLTIWIIAIDTTNEGLVQVYLGDLGRDLPYNEQLHWRQHNVMPKGKISDRRFKTDFLNEFTTPTIQEAPIYHFNEELNKVQENFKNYSGDFLFIELSKNDSHLLSTLHIPIIEEWKEFDEQLLALAKITCDSFNIKVLEKLTGKKVDREGKNGEKIFGPIGLFFVFLKMFISKQENIDMIIEPFNMVQAIRSKSVAHKKGESLEKTLKKYNLDNLNHEQRIKKMIIDLINSFQSIYSEFN